MITPKRKMAPSEIRKQNSFKPTEVETDKKGEMGEIILTRTRIRTERKKNGSWQKNDKDGEREEKIKGWGTQSRSEPLLCMSEMTNWVRGRS